MWAEDPGLVPKNWRAETGFLLTIHEFHGTFDGTFDGFSMGLLMGLLISFDGMI
jgi:hypothetical protein